MANSFGPLLRSLRQAAQLTIEELSHASGVSVRAIGDMERGISRGPQRRTVQALAEALRLDDEQRAELAEAARAGRPRPGGPGAERSENQVGRPRLYELPRGLGDFVGRVAELELLCEQGRAASADGPTPVVVVHGQAGLGKTACVVRAAELLREVFPDGQFYVDLRGIDAEPMPAAEALRRLLRALGLDPRAIAEEEQERASQLRAILAERRCLLVLDNAADEAQVRPLLPGAGAGMVVVTSRRTLGGLEGVTRIALAPFSPQESAELLQAIVREAADHAAAETAQVARLCGHLPLALRISGTRLASRPGWTMRHLAERLSDEDRRLANLAVGDLGVEAAFALSYAVLSPWAKVTFRRLALVPAVDFAAPIAAVLTQTELFAAEDQLDRLVELGLLQHEGADRYRFHDLIRLYASHRLRDEEPAESNAAAARRMADWLLEIATVAGRWFEPDYGAPPPDYKGLVPLATQEEARAWLEVERDTWLAALRMAAAADRHEQVAELGEAMRWFAAHTPHWLSDWLEVFGLTRAAAARLSDRRRELWHRNRHVWAFLVAYGPRGDAAFRECAERAMEVYRLAESLGAVREQADAVCNAAEAWRVLHDFDQALWAYTRGQELAEAAGYHHTYYWAASGRARTLARLGRLDEAIEAYRGVVREIDEQPVASAAAQHSRIAALQGLARTLLAAQRWQEAIDVAEPALAESIEQGSIWTMNMRWALGRAYAGLGVTSEAREHLTRAIELEDKYRVWGASSLDELKTALAALGIDHNT
ncbi:helix-turn-helix domain-containing protein [Nonomuraea turcica]|uniref:helix-turn-helix domain-containing protein n=1 Tax=Nonomuraea sp. G32 TaxID=3067274 RepID=UPI00273ADC53|nr:helix-turn-helix domain-containing protein [Nonomuraea sp. G32]MDP4509276.1 helix-turn-helix domain-containing protein [Nonomuraea sp. G32]